MLFLNFIPLLFLFRQRKKIILLFFLGASIHVPSLSNSTPRLTMAFPMLVLYNLQLLMLLSQPMNTYFLLLSSSLDLFDLVLVHMQCFQTHEDEKLQDSSYSKLVVGFFLVHFLLGNNWTNRMCKVEFNQPYCWFYSMPNLLVIQQLVTLYLGGNHVRVVCERV